MSVEYIFKCFSGSTSCTTSKTVTNDLKGLGLVLGFNYVKKNPLSDAASYPGIQCPAFIDEMEIYMAYQLVLHQSDVEDKWRKWFDSPATSSLPGSHLYTRQGAKKLSKHNAHTNAAVNPLGSFAAGSTQAGEGVEAGAAGQPNGRE